MLVYSHKLLLSMDPWDGVNYLYSFYLLFSSSFVWWILDWKPPPGPTFSGDLDFLGSSDLSTIDTYKNIFLYLPACPLSTAICFLTSLDTCKPDKVLFCFQAFVSSTTQDKDKRTTFIYSHSLLPLRFVGWVICLNLPTIFHHYLIISTIEVD